MYYNIGNARRLVPKNRDRPREIYCAPHGRPNIIHTHRIPAYIVVAVATVSRCTDIILLYMRIRSAIVFTIHGGALCDGKTDATLYNKNSKKIRGEKIVREHKKKTLSR